RSDCSFASHALIALSGGRPSVGPPEYCSVLDDAGEDDGELACKRDASPLEADAFGEAEAPGLEAGEPFDDRQKHSGRFVQQGSDHPVARSWRNFRLIGIESLALADYVAIAGGRRDNVEAFGAW